MSKKSTMVLGYTRSGHAVFCPTHHAPTSEDFVDWTRGDHGDAAHILREHSEREQDPEIRSWCKRWAKDHRGLREAARGKRESTRGVRVRGAAEISFKIRGPR